MRSSRNPVDLCVFKSFVAAAFLIGLAAPVVRAQVQPFQCSTSVAGTPPVVRAEGHAEKAGDILLTCTGGVPTQAGNSVPTLNFTIFLNTNITSKETSSGSFSEALLLIDEPNAASGQSSHPILNCGNTGAPDNSGSCTTLSTGNPATTYDGTVNGYLGGLCDGAGGRPAPNSLGCGRPNVFQAQQGSLQNPGEANSIVFANVPLDPPGQTLTRTIRITNIRADAAALGTGLYNSGQITANIAVNGATSISINNPQMAVAFIAPGMTASVVGSPGVSSPIRLLEGSSGAWKTKNLSFTVGDHNGTPGNAVLQSGSFSYTGGLNYPADAAQNVANANFGTESGFQWQNNAQNAPPSPNPPLGFGLPAAIGGGFPLQSAGATNSGINQAGVADSGTRVMLRFGNVPAGGIRSGSAGSVSFPAGLRPQRQPGAIPNRRIGCHGAYADRSFRRWRLQSRRRNSRTQRRRGL